MNIKKTLLILSMIFALFLSSCRSQGANDAHTSADSTASSAVDTALSAPTSLCDVTEDRGQEYIDSFIFFGESTTYHLKNRGVLSGGTETKQVWGPENGTVNLDSTIGSLKIIYPDTGEQLTIAEAIAKKKPQRILLTFGLNGAVSNIKRGREYFQSCYRILLDAIKKASPQTEIILQSAFPVAKNMDMSRYSVDLATLNHYIETINEWTLALARDYRIGYLDSASVLKDSDGCLLMSDQSGDGHHLTADAYRKILYYIRTHEPKKEVQA